MKLLSVTFLFLAIFLNSSVFAAQYFPLEITNIKPAGTGTPAIPSTNRIFRSYPGIEYNIRPAVIGGVYPYVYSLSNAPSGMTINSATGEISWPNPQSDSGTITLTVTDSESSSISTTWSIAVSTSGFIFVNNSYSGIETGSITQPYSSIANMLSNESTTTDIVYIRAGSYMMADHNSSAEHVMNLDSSPQTWIGYPDESVTINGSDSSASYAYRIYANTAPLYIDNLNFDNVVNYCFFVANRNYHTFRRCSFSNLTVDNVSNENYGFIFWSHELDPGYYAVIQDSTFSHWAGGSAIGSIYHIHKMVIENNYIHSTDGGGVTGINNGIAPKYNTDYLTVRGNHIDMDSGTPLGGNNAAFSGADMVEVCFNYIETPSGEYGPLLHFEDGTQEDSLWWRNTFVCNFTFRYLSGGTHTLKNNVIVNENTDFNSKIATNYISHGNSYALADLNLTQTDNIKGLRIAGIVDSNGDLEAAYSSYEGVTGWQFDDGSTPMDGAYTPATTYYKDADGDGYSDGTTTTTATTDYYLASALTATSGDCDDTDAAFNPGATQVCGNGLDEQTCEVIDDTCPTVSSGTVLTSGGVPLIAPGTGYVLITGE